MLERLYTWSIFCRVISSSERKIGAELACSGWASTFSVFSLTLSRFFLIPSSSRWICCRERRVPHSLPGACQLHFGAEPCPWLIPHVTPCQTPCPASQDLACRAPGHPQPRRRRSRAEKGKGCAAHQCRWTDTSPILGAEVPVCVRCTPARARAHTYLLLGDALGALLDRVLVEGQADLVDGAGLAALQLQTDVLQLGDVVLAQGLILLSCGSTRDGLVPSRSVRPVRVPGDGGDAPGSTGQRGGGGSPFSWLRSSSSYFWVQALYSRSTCSRSSGWKLCESWLSRRNSW